jgi:SP family facilitated glucose transporter-like MFS transporter 1
MAQMKSEYDASKMMKKTTVREMLTNHTLRIPLMISVILMIAQQFSGINAVSSGTLGNGYE